MRISGRFQSILLALLVTFLWSTSWVLIKNSIHEIQPLTFAGLRYSIAVLVLLPGLWRRRASLTALTRRQWGQLAALGLVFYSLTQGGQFLTLKYLDAIPFSLLLNFTAVVVAVVGIVLLREVPSRLQWAGIVIFIVGTAIYFFPISIPSGSIIGFVIAGFTVCANAAASLLGRSINRQKTISPLVVTVISMGIGAAVLLAVGVAVEGLPSLSVNNWGVIIWLAVVNTAFAFTLWNKTLQTLTAVESSIINNTMLIQIAILAWLFLGEQLSTQDVFGLALASIGILLVNIRLSKKPQAD